MKINPKISRLIAGTLIVLILMPSVLLLKPAKTTAFYPVADLLNTIFHAITSSEQTVGTATDLKGWAKIVLDEVLKAIARKALQEITKSTVNWINSGFHGNPLYIENSQSFFTDIAKSQVKTIVDTYGYDSMRFPYGKDFVLDVISSYKNQLSNNAEYSLSKVITDPVLLRNYQEDFATGGWNGFFINTQYPQNNILGSRIKLFDDLANRLNGLNQAPAQKIQSALQQGQGFLSPQICETNPDYNNLYNEFNRPSFNLSDYMQKNPYPDSNDPTAFAKWSSDLAAEQAKWAKTNTCPNNGLKNTTPGSVVANQIMTSLTSGTRSSELNAAIGSSLSAIFDALLNKFIGDGLSSLSSQSNNKPTEDTWNYNGITLGTTPVGGDGGNNADWSSTPDEIVSLADFKNKIKDAIGKTSTEIKYISNDVPDTFGPGIFQIMDQVGNKVKVLDVCQPGPDLNWQSRLDQEVSSKNTGSTSFGQENSSDSQNVASSVSNFKNWLTVQMKNALPSSSDFLRLITGLQPMYLDKPLLQSFLNTRSDALLTLKSIEAELNSINSEPIPGSTDENTMLRLYTEYKTLAEDISSDYSLADTKSQLLAIVQKSKNVDQLITACTTERTAKGWTNPGGATSTLTANNISEQTYFCDSPISSYIPGMSLDCSTIFNATPLDYQNSLPSY